MWRGQTPLANRGIRNLLRVGIEPLEARSMLAIDLVSLADPSLVQLASNGDVTAISFSGDGRYVAFGSTATNHLGDQNGFSDVYVKDTVTGGVQAVSAFVKSPFMLTFGNGNSGIPSISSSGRYVAFASDASNLIDNDTNGFRDVFVKDMHSGAIQIVSQSHNGELGNSLAPGSLVLSGNGNVVAFVSDASNLTPDDTNNQRDLFVRNLVTGNLVRIAIDSETFIIDGRIGLSEDGRYVTFAVATLEMPDAQVYVHDLESGSRTLVSTNESGESGDGISGLPSISASGRYVAFLSQSTNLVEEDNHHSARDLFWKDLQTGRIVLVNTSSEGIQSNGTIDSVTSISGDGSLVAFQSNATNLVPNDTNNTTDTFVKNLLTNETILVSRDSLGVQGNAASSQAILSRTGDQVAFVTLATNLLPRDTNGKRDIAIKNLRTQEIAWGSSLPNKGSNGDSWHHHDVSSDGRFVVFSTTSSDIVPGAVYPAASRFVRSVFRHDTLSGTMSLVSRNSLNEAGDGNSLNPSVSGDGRLVVFSTTAANLGNVPGIYMRDMDDDSLSFLGLGRNATISADGSLVALENNGTISVVNLESGNTIDFPGFRPRINDDGSLVFYRSFSNLWVWDSVTNQHSLVVSSLLPVNVLESVFDISEDGSHVVFLSEANGIVPEDNNFSADLFIKDMQSGVVTIASTDANGNVTDSWNTINQFYGSIIGRMGISIDRTGRFVTFSSAAPDLYENDTCPSIGGLSCLSSAYVKDTLTQKIMPVNIALREFSPVPLQEGYSLNFSPIISDDGKYVVFASNSPFIHPNGVDYGVDSTNYSYHTFRAFNPHLLPTGLQLAQSQFLETSVPATHPLFVSSIEADSEDPYELSYELLEGGDSSLFVIIENQLYLKPGMSLDFEVKSNYQIPIRATNTVGNFMDQTLSLQVLNQPEGTPGTDAFTVTFNATSILVNRSSNGGPQISQGSFPRNATLNIYGGDGADTVRVVGSNQDDTLSLSSSGLLFNGSQLVFHQVENLTLVGGAGNDTYKFIPSDSLGTVTLDESGGGNDTLDFSQSLAQGIQINLGDIATQIVTPSLSLRLQRNNAFENVVGTAWNDSILGNGLANRLSGMGGNDHVEAFAGNDILEGSTGSDFLNGGTGNDLYLFDGDQSLGSDQVSDSAGIDLFDFSTTTSRGITLNLATTGPQILNDSHTMTLLAGTVIETVYGTELGDMLTGNSAANTLAGMGGNDFVDGGAGNDLYLFDADTQLGHDTIQDVSGVDTLDFSGTATLGVTLSLLTTATQALNSNLSLTLLAALSLERIVGTESHDFLTGNSLANNLIGNGGNDTLDGGLGNDIYPIIANTPSGIDTIIDAGGIDQLNFSGTTTSGVSIDLGTSLLQTVNSNIKIILNSANSLENVIGTNLADTIFGNSLPNTLIGGAGNDVLDGRDGNDIYEFDSDLVLGVDQINDSSGTDTLHFAFTTTRSIQLNLGVTGLQVVNDRLSLDLAAVDIIENIVGGALGDTLYGNALENTLTGGLGNDFLSGGVGNDTYLFDADLNLGIDTLDETVGGIDKIDFSSTTTGGITIDLMIPSVQVVRPSYLSLILGDSSSFETVIGSGRDDTIYGNDNSNLIMGMSGNDVLFGRNGRDFLLGGLGSDQLHGGEGEDLLIVGTTTYDTSYATLREIQNAWNGLSTYLDRVTALRLGSNGTAPLTKTTVVRRDTVANTVIGSDSLDWFFANLEGTGILDNAFDLSNGEIVEEL